MGKTKKMGNGLETVVGEDQWSITFLCTRAKNLQIQFF